ncbi:MAG: fasciclin domain-containing protein [Saonia sp.]
MKTLPKILKISALALLFIFAASCSDDDDNGPGETPESNIVELAIATDDLSSLVAALQRANLVSALEADGPFTVFAPTNAAFRAFLDANQFAELEDVPVDLLTDILLNHVVSGENASTSLSTGYDLSSLSTAGVGGANLSLFIDTSSGVEINGVATVISTEDINASNGVIHIVDGVIGLPNIVDHALANPDLSALVGALTADGNTTFTDLLSTTDEDFTVFAPVNAAFDAFTNPADNAIANVLSNHVVVGAAALSTSLSTGYDISTAATNADMDNLSLYINTADGVRINGVSSVAVPDVIATNGVIHAVDAVIDIPTVVTFAAADPNFSTLLEALTTLTPATDFGAVLSTPTGTNPAPFTVFAPTNDAFAALASIPEEAALTPILQHHVVAGNNIRSGDLTVDGTTTTPATLEGDTFDITLPGTDGNIADVTDGAGNTGIGIIAVDVQAGNGVIHVVNTVLLPDTMN